MRVRLPRVRFTVRRMMVAVAVAAVLIAATVAVVEWRETMRPLWDDFRAFANKQEVGERHCLRMAASAERIGNIELAKKFRADAAEYAERKRRYRHRWW